MVFQPVLFAALLALFQVECVLAMPQEKNPLQAMCLCDDVSMPECPVNFLAGRSLCHCKNQRELACWKLQWNQANCPSPLPWACDDLDRAGNPKHRMTPRATAVATPATFKATYRGESGLNCVDLGYCYRPTKGRTTVVVSVSTGGSVTITVPVGLPSDAVVLPTQGPVAPRTKEPEIVFTQERWRGREVPMTAGVV